MADYRFRSVRPDGLIVHELGAETMDLAGAEAHACKLARGLILAAPEGKDWSGWYVDVLDIFGRWLLRIPFSMASDASAHLQDRISMRLSDCANVG